MDTVADFEASNLLLDTILDICKRHICEPTDILRYTIMLKLFQFEISDKSRSSFFHELQLREESDLVLLSGAAMRYLMDLDW